MGDPVEYEIQEHITNKGGIYYNQGLYYCKPKQLAPKTPKNRFFFSLTIFGSVKQVLKGNTRSKSKMKTLEQHPQKFF